jgi:ADP-ribose pyrophosphatase YjhB (NUDIX family)
MSHFISDRAGRREVWESRSVAMSIMVSTNLHCGAEVNLITRRGKSVSYPGLWCLPCGFLDFGETIVEGAQRELYEETGLFLNTRLLRLYQIGDDPAREECENIVFHFSAILSHEDYRKISLNFDETEVEAGGFFTDREILSKEFAFDHQQRILNRELRKKRLDFSSSCATVSP